MLPSPAPFNVSTGIAVDNVGVAVGGVDGSGQETLRSNLISNKTGNPNVSNPDNDPSNPQGDILDEYKEPDSEDEYDVDTQSLVEGIEPGEEIGTDHQVQKGPLSDNSNMDEIRDVTGKQGLSPRGRKLLKQNKNTSISKPNTRARSRGF
ncbi:hypothetical protein EJD97_004304 [Solanum chilense]|uniref:Uncharacterized protein n=1 Tax=Solanum chilense TaxID=4083 RepID=A0A6N2BRV5_SOLCI|nr:hypothetical protein EJD97_004304 [Solanum chilense]